MEMYASCDCGWTLRATEGRVTAALREHGVEVHGIELTDEQILAVSRPVAPGGGPTDPEEEPN